MIIFSKRCIHYTLLFLLVSSTYGVEQKQSLITIVKELHKQSLDLPSEVTQPIIVSEKDKKNLTLQVNLLSADQIIPMIYDLCEAHITLGNQSLTQTDPTFLTKMELFSGGEHKKKSLLHHIDNTKTSFGKVLLALQLAQPTYDITSLTLRQDITKELINDEVLLNKIDEQLALMAAAEPYLLSYFEHDNQINEELFKKVYFGEWLQSLNTNSVALEGITRLGNFLNLYTAALIPVSILEFSIIGKYTNASLMHQANPDHFPKPSLLKATEDTIKRIPGFIKFLDPRRKATNGIFVNGISTPETLGDVLHMLNEEAKKSPEHAKAVRIVKGVYGGIFGLTAAYQGYLTYSAYKDAKLKKDIANYLQRKLIAVASYIKAAKTLYQLAKDNPVLTMIPGMHHLEKFASHRSLSSDAKALLNLLDHNTFTGDASVFSLTGRVLAAHQLMKKVKNELIPVCAAASTFDVYNSTAKLYKKFEHTRVHYSFPKYVNNVDMPYVATLTFWNPGVDASIVVANDIIFGKDSPNNIILTGPNTGGKSTVIKSVLINLLLAQTIGIAPSDLLQFTPFAVLNCYLNITDDLAAGVSLFKAEVLRAKALIEAIRALKPGEFSFTIMDEVFSGTSPKEGEEAAFMFAKELGIMPNSICSIATHFPKLTELEETHQFKNYQVKVWKDENNHWVRPFKLEEGKSTINIAMDLLEEAGIFSK